MERVKVAETIAGGDQNDSLGFCSRMATIQAMCNETNNRITSLGRINFRNDRRLFGIRQADRRAHMHIIGKTGTGESTLLETMMRQDITAGRGLAVLDPHGDIVERVLAWIPQKRKDDLILVENKSSSPLQPVLFLRGEALTALRTWPTGEGA